MKRLHRLDFCATPDDRPRRWQRIAIGALLLGVGAGLISLLWQRLN